MIVRIIHGKAATTNPDAGMADPIGIAAGARPGSPDDRTRLARAAARINGLETLILGWRRRGEPALEAGETEGASVVVLVWLDAESMLAAAYDEATFLRDRLGITIDIERADTYEVVNRTFGSLPTPTAVLRILTLRARATGEATLFERLRDIQTRLTAHGLIASHIARRVGRAGIEALVVSVWSDDAAIEAATTGRTDRPAYAEELEPWIDSVTIDVYEAMEIAPKLPMSSGPPILILDGSRRIVDLTPAAAAVLGQTQDEAVGMSIEALAGPGNEAASERWLRSREDGDAADEVGDAAWPLSPGGQVMIRWRLRRDVPVPGRHTVLVRRRHEPEPTSEALDAALIEAFPPGPR
jgi:PAS domain-containing protein